MKIYASLYEIMSAARSTNQSITQYSRLSYGNKKDLLYRDPRKWPFYWRTVKIDANFAGCLMQTLYQLHASMSVVAWAGRITMLSLPKQKHPRVRKLFNWISYSKTHVFLLDKVGKIGPYMQDCKNVSKCIEIENILWELIKLVWYWHYSQWGEQKQRYIFVSTACKRSASWQLLKGLSVDVKTLGAYVWSFIKKCRQF